MKKIILGFLLSILTSSIALAVPKFDHKNFEYKNGQIIAISETLWDSSTFFFEAFTGSRYGHIGIVIIENGKPMVYEANPPHTAKVNVEEFLDRSTSQKGKHQATVLELTQPLSKAEVKSLTSVLKDLVKKQIPYNSGQTMNDYSLNCSEFVFKAFNSINRFGIGAIQTIADLNAKSFGGLLMQYWERLSGKPIDTASKYVSPASIVFSSSTKAVAANLPFDKIISDKDILKGWTSEMALEVMNDQIFGLKNDELKQMLESAAGDKAYKKLNLSNKNGNNNSIMCRHLF